MSLGIPTSTENFKLNKKYSNKLTEESNEETQVSWEFPITELFFPIVHISKNFKKQCCILLFFFSIIFLFLFFVSV